MVSDCGTPARTAGVRRWAVESLKVALLKALKNAGNIHELKPSDTAVVVVRGGPSGKQTRTWQAWRAANFAADSGPHLATGSGHRTNINFAVNAAGTTEHSRKQIEIGAANLQLEKAERDYKRAQELVNSKSIPQETFDDTKTTFELAKNTVEQKLKELHLIEYQRISDDPLRGDMPKIMTGYVTPTPCPPHPDHPRESRGHQRLRRRQAQPRRVY